MPNFKYKAMNENGDRLQGTYAADSRDEVMDMISANNYYPLLVEEIQQGTTINLSIFDRVTTKDIAIFCRQFYTMLDAGVSINSSLNILARQLPNKKLREVLSKVEDNVKKGETLSESMKLQGKVFPDLLISMVETGEMSGNLDNVMLRMSTHFEKENKINNKIKGAMVYPAVLSVMAVGVVTILLTFVLPTFIDMFTQSGVELPMPTKILLGISGALSKHGLVILLIIILIVLGLRYYFKSDSGQLFISKFKLTFPILKGLNQKIIVSRFTRTLSTMLSSGVSLVQALETVSEVVGNKLAQDKLLEIREELIKGEGLSKPIEESKIFPPMLASMIKIGEESGSLDDILNKTADFYDDEVETTIQTTTALIEPLLILIMGLVVGFIVISIMLPMFTMYEHM
ncbi:type II secretion system F family protein [Clostridium sp. YIM B02505]|uniref:Type II secretion system F family protein n=1 Tax=Clostridium yunnanense TaxID=2800325 RepID=A0ABS1EM98_9CLOT|nr:type II secretion system F family protein [Clostridium yunnanense]MBK1810497.1 type II secretion system F family protein [Clostridium yunnanense]